MIHIFFNFSYIYNIINIFYLFFKKILKYLMLLNVYFKKGVEVE